MNALEFLVLNRAEVLDVYYEHVHNKHAEIAGLKHKSVSDVNEYQDEFNTDIVVHPHGDADVMVYLCPEEARGLAVGHFSEAAASQPRQRSCESKQHAVARLSSIQILVLNVAEPVLVDGHPVCVSVARLYQLVNELNMANTDLKVFYRAGTSAHVNSKASFEVPMSALSKEAGGSPVPEVPKAPKEPEARDLSSPDPVVKLSREIKLGVAALKPKCGRCDGEPHAGDCEDKWAGSAYAQMAEGLNGVGYVTFDPYRMALEQVMRSYIPVSGKPADRKKGMHPAIAAPYGRSNEVVSVRTADGHPIQDLSDQYPAPGKEGEGHTELGEPRKSSFASGTLKISMSCPDQKKLLDALCRKQTHDHIMGLLDEIEAAVPEAAKTLVRGIRHQYNRAVTYDTPGGERSMEKVVPMFNTLYGKDLTVEQGWMFQVILKQVRSANGEYKEDSYEDGSSYIGLSNEAAKKERG